MAEEVLYDQVDNAGGDPDPLGLRKKLSSMKGGSPDPLGIRAKLQPAAKEQTRQATPTFKPMSDWLAIPGGYQPMVAENAVAVDDHTKNTAQASDRLKGAIENIDPHIGNLIYEKKKDLQGRIKSEQLGLNPREASPINDQVAQVESKIRTDVAVHPDEITEFKAEMNQNGGMLRDALKQQIKDLTKKDPTKANQLKADIYRVDAQDRPDNEKKIAKNAEKLASGELEYDPSRGLLYKPEGFFGSLVLGYKEKKQLFKDYDKYKNTENEAAIIKDLNDRLKEQDPDDPIHIPEGAGEFGAMIGGQPLKPIIGGAIAGAFTSGLGGATAAAAISAPEMYKLGYASALQNNYAALKKENPEMPDYDAYTKAKSLAEDQANVDAVTGAAMGLIGGKLAFKPSNLLTKSVGSALRQIGEKGLEGLGVGAIGGGGQVVKNLMAQKAGLPVDETEGVVQQLAGGVVLTAGMHLAAKSANLLKPSTYNKLLQGLSKQPEETINANLERLQSVGQITPDEATNLKTAITEHKAIDNQIPDNIPEIDRLKIQAKIKERDILKGQLEKVHEAYHPEIKERIKSIDEQILNISKGGEREELQTLVHDEVKNGKVEGFVAEELLNAKEKDLQTYFKDIAEQANDPATEQAAIDTFGKKIVDKARELYPKEEPAQIETAPVEAANEVNEIKPTEDAIPVGSSLNSQESYGKHETDKDIFPKRPQTQPRIDRKTAASVIGEEEIPRLQASIDWLEAIERNDSEKSQNAKRELIRQSVATQRQVREVLDDYDSGGAQVRTQGDYGTKVGAEIESQRTRSSQGSQQPQQSSGQLGTVDSFEAQQPSRQGTISGKEGTVTGLSEAERESVVEKIQSLSGMQDNSQKAQSARILRDMLEQAIRENKPQEVKEIIDLIKESISGSQEGSALPKEEGVIEGQEKIATPREIGITHRQMDAIAEEFGLPTYEKAPERVKEWDERAAKMLAEDPQALPRLFEKLRNGEAPGPEETRMMVQYMGDLMAKIDKNPTNEALLTQLKRTKDLFNIAGRVQGQGLRARKGNIPAEERLGDFLIRDMEANKAPLTEEQKAQAVKEYEAIKTAKDALEQKVEQLKADKAKLVAEKKIKEQAKAASGGKKDFKSERKQIVADIKEKLRKARGETSIVAVPYAKELIAIAPEVAKLVKSYVEQGITELPELVKQVREALKDDIPEITEKDVHNIIAGEYSEKKPTKSELAQQLYDIKKEARLINELETLQSGEVPKSKERQKHRNQKIEKLKNEIKELRDEMGLNERTEEQKLSALKSRYKKNIQEIEEKIKAGDFGPDEKPEPLVLDKEAQDLKDKYIEVKKERELRLAKQEYENRPLKERAFDFGAGLLDLRRMVGTAFDFSVPFRQALPVTINPTKLKTTAQSFKNMFSHWYSAKNLDRWWFDLENSPDYKAMQEDGLPVHSPNELRISKREEEFRTTLAEQIPLVGAGIKASNRAASGYLNTMRVDLYRKGTALLEAQGLNRQNSPEVYKALANNIANLTGSGKLLPWLEGKPATALGGIFFGARLMASKFNLLNPVTYAKMPKPIMKMALKDLAVRTGMYVSAGMLAKAAGASVSLDPNDPNFLKIKTGNTSYDITGGEAIYVRTFLRVMAAAKERISGQESSSAKAAEKAGKSVTSFFRNKLAPTPSYGLDAFLGKKSYGAKFDPYDIVRIYPMWIDDIVDDYKQEGPSSIIAAGIPSIFGIGVMTMGNKEGGSGGGGGATGKVTKPSKPSKTAKPSK